MRNRHGRMAMAGVYALMLCIGVIFLATILRPLGINDDAYRLMSEVITQHPTALCSYLLYVPLYLAICICGWAMYKRHNHVKWFSAGNIISTFALYIAIAAVLSISGVPLFLDAALNPLFWMAYNIVGVLKCTCALIGACTIIYGAYLGVVRLKRFLANRRPLSENEINTFTQDLDALLGDLRRNPELRKACNALQRRQDKTTG